MPVTGAKAVKANMKRIFKDISQKKAPQFVNAVLSIGLNHSKELAPIEFAKLIGSTITNIEISNTSVKGTLSYNTLYAAFLEFNQKWKPRPIDKKKGPAWNPNAKPHYLKRGFDDSESRALIKKAEEIFRI